MNPKLQLLDDAIRAIQKRDLINAGIGAAVGYGGGLAVNAIAGHEVVNPLVTGGLNAVLNPLSNRYLNQRANARQMQEELLERQRPQPSVTITPKYRTETVPDFDDLDLTKELRDWGSTSYMSSDELDEYMMM